MKFSWLRLLNLLFFGCFLSLVEARRKAQSSQEVASEELESLIHSVQEENVRLWGFVKDYQQTMRSPSAGIALTPPKSSKKVHRIDTTPRVESAKHKRRGGLHPKTQESLKRNPSRIRRARRLTRKDVLRSREEVAAKERKAKKAPQPKKRTVVPSMKMWNFELGVRNLSNNSADGFQHDHEIFHKLSRRIRSRHRAFIESKSVYFRGDGSGTFSRLGFGFQQFLKKFQDQPRWNPYVAAIVDHWRGDMEIYKGIPLVKKKDSKDVYTTRLGAEYNLSNSSNLDIFVEHGRNHLDFIDANGTTIELHARSNLYGLGILHEF